MTLDERWLILVVEDEAVIRDSIVDVLRLAGLSTLTATNGLDALQLLHKATPDLVIADIMMPRMNGYQLYERLRDNPDWTWIPFIFLSAKGTAEDIRYGKELGADDYLTKPIEPDDLVSAVMGKLKRYAQFRTSDPVTSHPRPTGCYRVGPLVVDLGRHTVTANGRECPLSPTEFSILQRLVLAGDLVVTYEELMEQDGVSPLDGQDAARLARYHIRDLRKKLDEAAGQADLVVNVSGMGYRLALRPEWVE
jgi:DNA-binding response OmpR family regulator